MNEKEQVIELDLRPMPPFERHEKIFEIWEGLKQGQVLKAAPLLMLLRIWTRGRSL